jgi:hypothetical protein
LVHLLRTAALGASVLIALPILGCSSSGDQQAATPGLESSTTEQTTTDTGPQPITAAEEMWVGEMTNLAARMKHALLGTKVLTNSAMIKNAKAYSTCLPSLRQAGDPGRFGPAANIAKRACMKLNSAGNMMKKAAAIDSAGIESQTEADKYNDLVTRSIDAQANAISVFERAKLRAQEIGQQLG